jgi:cytochrome P450 family 6
VDVTETMYRYATDVITTCAFRINGNSLNDPDAEFRFLLRKIFDFTFRKGLAELLEIFAPALTSPLKLKFVDDGTTNYLRRMVWSTVEYR